MNNRFNINIPTTIICDSIENINIAELLPKYIKKILIVTSTTTRSQSIEQFVCTLNNHFEVYFYRVKSGDPTYQMVDEGASISQKIKVDFIIAIGGGSKIDLAKAIAIRHYFNCETKELLRNPSSYQVKKALKILAIPTTAGTGSELSKGAVLTNEKTKMKSSLRTTLIIPQFTIVDSKLTITVPQKTTAITGFDVFTHAFETYFSNAGSPFTKLLSERVMQICHATLPRLLEDLSNNSLREKMSMSSLWMGYNLAQASTCLPHRIQYALSIFTSLDHAECLSVVYPSWLNLINKKNPRELENVVEIFSMGKSRSVNYLIEWIDKLSIRTSLTDHGLERKQSAEIANLVTGNLKLDPVYRGFETVNKILFESF